MTTQTVKIAPSILSADFSRLGEQVQAVEQGGADWIHVDVMDGHFVPNITIGPVVVQALRSRTRLPLDVHLMIEQPDLYLEDFVQAGADLLTVHVEACKHLHRTLDAIRRYQVKAGVAINPHTPIESIYEILEMVDLVLIMSVNPGFGGQRFIPFTLNKIRRLRSEMERRGLHHILIEIDGGIKLDNAPEVVVAGTDVIVSGSGIFHTEDPALTVQEMKRRCLEAVGKAGMPQNGKAFQEDVAAIYFADHAPFQGSD